MLRILLATITAAMLGGCAHWQHAHGEHAAHGDMAACQGQGKEGEMCPLRNKDAANSSMPDCCKGKMAPAGTN